jgi:hypothetical protein
MLISRAIATLWAPLLWCSPDRGFGVAFHPYTNLGYLTTSLTYHSPTIVLILTCLSRTHQNSCHSCCRRHHLAAQPPCPSILHPFPLSQTISLSSYAPQSLQPLQSSSRPRSTKMLLTFPQAVKVAKASAKAAPSVTARSSVTTSKASPSPPSVVSPVVVVSSVSLPVCSSNPRTNLQLALPYDAASVANILPQ